VPVPAGLAVLRLMSIWPQSMPLKSQPESGYQRTVLWRTMLLRSAIRTFVVVVDVSNCMLSVWFAFMSQRFASRLPTI
jgi:hypothetical protein